MPEAFNGASSPDFYFFNSGPFSVRVFEDKDRVEAAARVYLANNKYFGFEMDYSDHLGPTVELARYSEAFRAVLSRETQLMAIDYERSKPRIEPEPEPEEVDEDKRVVNIIGQLVIFDGREYFDGRRYNSRRR